MKFLRALVDVSFIILFGYTVNNDNFTQNMLYTKFIFNFKTDLQCLQAVVESKTKTLHAKCYEMLMQRMEMFKNAKALVREIF